MLLSVGMIQDELPGFFQECRFFENDRRLNLLHARFYDNELAIRGDTLYLFPDEEQTPFNCLSFESGTAIVLRENRSDIPDNVSVFLLSASAPQLPALFNRILQVFEKYDRYESALNELTSTCKNLQSIVSFVTPFFGNEITVRDSDYRILAKSYRTLKYLERVGIPQPMDNGVMRPEELSSLKRNFGYEKETHSKEPVFWHANEWKLNYIYLDIFDQERFLYRIKVCDVNRPLRAYDAELLKHLANVIHSRFYRFTSAPGSTATILQKTMLDLIDAPESVADKRIEYFLENVRWRSAHHFVCAAIQLNETDETMDNFSWYCSLLNREFAGVFPFHRENRVLLLVNLDSGYQGKSEIFLRQLVFFIRGNDLRAGVSLEFQDMKHMRTFALQAISALEIGLKKSPYVWVHRFDEHLLDYLRFSFTRDFGGVLECFPMVGLLESYDKRKNSELLKTLRVYLENDRNLSQTAGSLFIHRGTLSYRLEKIEKIIGFSLENNEKLMHIRLALMLLPDVGK